MNPQGVGGSDGTLLWVSGPQPGAVRGYSFFCSMAQIPGCELLLCRYVAATLSTQRHTDHIFDIWEMEMRRTTLAAGTLDLAEATCAPGSTSPGRAGER
ncbi:hypothetical protein ACFY4C_33105 [Actinomadura viridis]|uniref:hypothetical protein n=1 Tax=Actinomadura viridis TaxID=58110 RepID=UPI0036C308F0